MLRAMLRRFVLVGLLVFAARTSHADSVSLGDAMRLAQKFVAAAMPCDATAVDAIVDEEALAAKIAKLTKSAGAGIGAALSDTGATVVCASTKPAAEYKVLHVRSVDGEPRAILRRLVRAPRTGVLSVAYDELRFARTGPTHAVRVVDIYYYVVGQSLSELMSGFVGATMASSPKSGALKVVLDVKAVFDLKAAGKFAEALQKLDALPPKVRDSRVMAIARVNIANSISQDEYGKALDDVARLFPRDPSIALLEIDGAYLRQDYTAALAMVDVVDRAIGGDPYQDTLRASILLKRDGSGDLAKAAKLTAAVLRAEPSLQKAWETKIDVAVAQRDWTSAVDALDHLRTVFGMIYAEDKLRALPGNYGDLLDSKEYKAWKARQ